jgi:hypothetical protein
LVIGAFLAYAEEEGKYRPDLATTSTTTTSTIRPYTWNPRWNPSWNIQNPNWNDGRVNNNWDRTNRGRWNNTGYNWNPQQDWTRNRWDNPAYGRDWRTLRLDETADARGYTYVYETVGGIVAEENGVFETVALRHDGQRINGQVIITDREGVTYKINYQVESKEPYVARGLREAERVPPTIARLLALLESHK